jgi:predicted SAM-dependent methyltransferase
MLKLNLGSGQRPFAKPWVNIDIQERWSPDLVADCSHLPYDDGSCSMIVFSHVLEHFGCGDGQGVLRESHRLLETGGSLIVAVPNLRALAQNWLMGKLDTETYIINLYGAYMGDEADRHKFGFVEETLRDEIQRAGAWHSVLPFDWRAISGMDVGKDWWVLAMEAVK